MEDLTLDLEPGVMLVRVSHAASRTEIGSCGWFMGWFIHALFLKHDGVGLVV